MVDIFAEIYRLGLNFVHINDIHRALWHVKAKTCFAMPKGSFPAHLTSVFQVLNSAVCLSKTLERWRKAGRRTKESQVQFKHNNSNL